MKRRQLPDSSFDRVIIKSGNHEIPLAQQLALYDNIFEFLNQGVSLLI